MLSSLPPNYPIIQQCLSETILLKTFRNKIRKHNENQMIYTLSSRLSSAQQSSAATKNGKQRIIACGYDMLQSKKLKQIMIIPMLT